MIHPALSSAFPPTSARFGEALGPLCAEATPLSELLGTTQLPRTAARYAATFPGETRAALSLWSQYYLLALVTCAASLRCCTRI